MLARMIASLQFLLLILFVTAKSSATPGPLFTVTGTGGQGAVDVTVWLNGVGPLSGETFHVTGGYDLTIAPTVGNRTYPAMGLEINTPGLVARSGCASYQGNRCIFPASLTSPAQIIVSPQGNACTTVNGRCRVFLSTSTTTGNMIDQNSWIPALDSCAGSSITTGIQRANCYCQNDPKNLDQGTYAAWLSDANINARSNINYLGTTTYVRENTPEITVATPGTLLSTVSTPLQNAIDSNAYSIWTGTEPNGEGSAGDVCVNWASESFPYTARLGLSSQTSSGWTRNIRARCNDPHKVYCFEVPR